MNSKNIILKSVVVGVLLNIILAFVVTPYATPDEVKPPDGAGKLSYYSQVIHILSHHNQIKLTSSLVVGVLVALSVYIASCV